jgi:hypothetical protein
MKLPTTSMHRCHHCGATSYRQVIERNAQGAMGPSGRYRCTGCEVVFVHTREWRDGSARPEQRDPERGMFQPLTTGSSTGS